MLRRGKLVGDRRTAGINAETLAGLMMGTVSEHDVVPKDSTAAIATGMAAPNFAVASAAAPVENDRAMALSVTGLTVIRDGRTILDSVDLDVAVGEIVGIAGISGNGQTDLMDALSGVERPSAGSMIVAGEDLTCREVADRLSAGLGRLTEDRRGSVIPQMSVEYNLIMEDLKSFTRYGLLNRSAVRANAEALIERFAIRARPMDPMGTLSGGNIQKVLLARSLSRKPKILVVAQPTRGLDIGAYGYVHGQLRELRDRGAGVLVISEDLDELRALCSRIAVLFRGQIMGTLPVVEASNERLGVMMTGELANV